MREGGEEGTYSILLKCFSVVGNLRLMYWQDTQFKMLSVSPLVTLFGRATT